MYLAKSLADKLYLLQVNFSFTGLSCFKTYRDSLTDLYFVKFVFLTQYPVRPATMTYDDVNHLSAKIKPKQQKVNTVFGILKSV